MSTHHGPSPCVRHSRLYQHEPVHFCPRCAEDQRIAEKNGAPPMTTDPFTDAAEDRVDELWPYAPAGFPLPPARRMDRRIGFRLGAQWARDHFAAHAARRDEETR